MAKVVVREECFNFSLLLLSLFLFYGDRQWQDCLIWRFSITGCLGYVCRRQKGSTLKGKKMSWKGTLPWLLIPICNLGSKYGNYLSCVAIGTQEQKRVCPEWKCASLWSEDDKLQKNYRIFFFFFFWDVIFLKHTLLDIRSRTNGSGFVPWTESACKGGGDMKLAL